MKRLPTSRCVGFDGCCGCLCPYGVLIQGVSLHTGIGFSLNAGRCLRGPTWRPTARAIMVSTDGADYPFARVCSWTW